MNSMLYIGLDIHKKIIAYCVKSDNGGTGSVEQSIYLFENINQQTINGITSTCNIFLDDLVNRNQIYEHLTVVDDSPELVDNNTLGVTVKFKPMKHLEFVELNFMIKSLSSGL